MKAWTIVGYTYRSENWMPEAIVNQLTTNPGDMAHARGRTARGDVEKHLDLLARIYGVDRTDESSYDSSDFPKVIFADALDFGEQFRDSDGTYVDPLAG